MLNQSELKAAALKAAEEFERERVEAPAGASDSYPQRIQVDANWIPKFASSAAAAHSFRRGGADETSARVFIGQENGPAELATFHVKANSSLWEAKMARFRAARAAALVRSHAAGGVDPFLPLIGDCSTVRHMMTNVEAAELLKRSAEERCEMAAARIRGQFEATGRRIHRPVLALVDPLYGHRSPDAHLGGVGGE